MTNPMCPIPGCVINNNHGHGTGTFYSSRDTALDLKMRDGDQPLPLGNDEEPCHTSAQRRVDEDLPNRLAVGIQRYGQPLQPFNGRDFAQDAWEELMDLTVYFEGLRRERDAMIEVLKMVRNTIAIYGDSGNAVIRDKTEALLKSMGVE